VYVCVRGNGSGRQQQRWLFLEDKPLPQNNHFVIAISFVLLLRGIIVISYITTTTTSASVAASNIVM